MKIAVTGDADEITFDTTMWVVAGFHKITQIIETGGSGADLLARFWAEENGIDVVTVRGATPVARAKEIVKLRPKCVVQFGNACPALEFEARKKGIQISQVLVHAVGPERGPGQEG